MEKLKYLTKAFDIFLKFYIFQDGDFQEIKDYFEQIININTIFNNMIKKNCGIYEKKTKTDGFNQTTKDYLLSLLIINQEFENAIKNIDEKFN